MKTPKVYETWKSPNNKICLLLQKLDDMGNFWWKVQSVEDGTIGYTVISPRDDWKFIS